MLAAAFRRPARARDGARSEQGTEVGEVREVGRDTTRTPIVFFSYSHADDANSGGRVTRLRIELEKALHVVWGREIRIFQDNNSIEWGERWKERIDGTLDGATDGVSGLIVVLSPSFFTSQQCRRELDLFLERERRIGRRDLLLPIHWVDTPRLAESSRDRLGREMAARHQVDWRELRHQLPAAAAEPVSALIAQKCEELARRLLNAFGLQSQDSDDPTGQGQSTGPPGPPTAPPPPTPPPTPPTPTPAPSPPAEPGQAPAQPDRPHLLDEDVTTASPTRVAEELRTLGPRLARIEEMFRAGARYAAEAVEHFADPTGLLEPADPDFLTDSGRGLRPWLADLTAAVEAGRRLEAAVGIREWQAAAAAVEAVARRLVAANQEPFRRSEELAGRLRTYRALVRDRGLIEDPELTRLHAAAARTLRRAPADLDLADRRIAEYTSAVIERGGSQ